MKTTILAGLLIIIAFLGCKKEDVQSNLTIYVSVDYKNNDTIKGKSNIYIINKLDNSIDSVQINYYEKTDKAKIFLTKILPFNNNLSFEVSYKNPNNLQLNFKFRIDNGAAKGSDIGCDRSCKSGKINIYFSKEYNGFSTCSSCNTCYSN